MSEKSWHKREEMNTLRYQMNSLFDELINENIPNLVNVENRIKEPAIEIKETELNLIIQAQVPGIEAKDLDIHVTRNTVLIAGEYHEQKVHNEKVIYHSEFSYGHFQRKVTLPVYVDYKQVKAEINNGLLKLSQPKANGKKYDAEKLDLTIKDRAGEILVKKRQNIENEKKNIFKRPHPEIDATH